MLQQIQQWLNKLYFYSRVLSIDIVLGAISVSFYASHLFKSQTPNVYWLLLPMAVWSIYTFDHITDGLSVEPPKQKPSYQFHYTYISILIPVVSIIGIATLVLSFVFFNMPIFLIALVGGGLIGIYFFIHKTLHPKLRNWFPKELLISTGYVIGTFGVPFLTKSREANKIDVLVPIAFFLLVLTNVFIYSYFEFEDDKQNGFVGLIQTIGHSMGYKIILFLIIVTNVFCLFLLLNNTTTSLITLLMSLSMSWIILRPKLFLNNRLYGKIADALFLLPGIIVLLSKTI